MVAMFIILLGTYWDIILGSSFQLLFIIKDSQRKNSYMNGILENRDLRIERTIELIFQNKPPATSQRMIKPQPMIITYVVSSWKQKIEAWIRSELKEDLYFWWVLKCVHPYFVKNVPKLQVQKVSHSSSLRTRTKQTLMYLCTTCAKKRVWDTPCSKQWFSQFFMLLLGAVLQIVISIIDTSKNSYI